MLPGMEEGDLGKGGGLSFSLLDQLTPSLGEMTGKARAEGDREGPSREGVLGSKVMVRERPRLASQTHGPAAQL